VPLKQGVAREYQSVADDLGDDQVLRNIATDTIVD
jgi:hypothetical protein